MGYPTHFPRAIVYAPIEVGGLGFCHLGHKQGVQNVLQLVKHLRAMTLNGELYRMLIDTYQIMAGSVRPILEHTAPFSWCPNWAGYQPHVTFCTASTPLFALNIPGHRYQGRLMTEILWMTLRNTYLRPTTTL